MKYILTVMLCFFITACSTPQYGGKEDKAPLVSIVFAGPVLDGNYVRFRYTLVTTDPSANIAMIAPENGQGLAVIDQNAKFEIAQFKNPQGEIVTGYQWTGYTEPVEVTDSSPSWLYDGKDTHTSLKAGVAVKNSNGYQLIGSTVQTATYSNATKSEIIKTYQYNKIGR